MKKMICILLALFIMTGCGEMNTPTSKVEALLNKYQMNDEEVMNDLDNVLLSDSNLTDNERTDYRNFMKNHYKDLTYKVKNETIDGDSATVDVEITVRDYSNVVNEANSYRMQNAAEFDDNNSFAGYRLDRLKEVKDTVIYTISFHLTKVNDEWKVDPLTTDDESKLNGLFGVTDVNESITNTTTDVTGDGLNNQNETQDVATTNVTDE